MRSLPLFRMSPLVRIARLLLALVSLTMLFIACQQLDIATSTKNSASGHNHIQVVGSGSDGIWPPKPANMTKTGVLVGNYSLQTNNNNIQKTSLKDEIMADGSLRSVLGADYLLLDINISEEKNGALIQEIILFSYSNNTTIRAWLMPDRSVEYHVMAASEYQFPETAEEIAKSISLARTKLVDQGFNDAATLNAHSMLTYPNDASGEQFFDVRMLYVTLGDGNGAVPVYAAWVDLSNNIVTKSGPIGSY